MEGTVSLEKGSSFTMFLPRAAEPAIRPKPVAVADPKATEGKECVMIVDDEELVRLVTKAVLAYRGYESVWKRGRPGCSRQVCRQPESSRSGADGHAYARLNATMPCSKSGR